MSWSKINAVKAGRAIRGQSQEELAELLAAETGKPWTRDKVASLENGRKKFDVDTLEAIAKVQDLPLAFYMFGPSEANSAKGGSLSWFMPALAS